MAIHPSPGCEYQIAIRCDRASGESKDGLVLLYDAAISCTYTIGIEAIIQIQVALSVLYRSPSVPFFGSIDQFIVHDSVYHSLRSSPKWLLVSSHTLLPHCDSCFYGTSCIGSDVASYFADGPVPYCSILCERLCLRIY